MMKNTTKNEMINGWNMSLFNYNGGYLSYGQYYSPSEKFVARFKYAAQKRRKNSFIKFLVNNFTPLEYFTATGIQGKAPLTALMEKGYVVKGL